MTVFQRPAVLPVLRQHVEDAAGLFELRLVQLRSPHVQLHRLARLDERIAAHLQGLSVHGERGVAELVAEMAQPSPGKVFALAVMALVQRHADLLTRIVALAQSLPQAEEGLLGALAWVSAQDLQGTVRALLGSKLARHRVWGLAACAAHRVDPGVILLQAVDEGEADVLAQVFLVAGQLGRVDLLDAARRVLASAPTPVVARHAAWALTLSGAGHSEHVRQGLLLPDEGQVLPLEAAHRLAVLVAPMDWSREQVRQLAAQAQSSKVHLRRMIRMTAWVGDPQVVPWLIHHMADAAWARLAGESFSLITGVDMAAQGLDRSPPSNIDAGPNDDPEQDEVAMDEDDSLPWPDAAKVQAWWSSHAGRFQVGQRYFGGNAPSVATCLEAWRTAGQRQRTIAAEYLCLLRPGSKLLSVTAPAWRQSRWLKEEEAALT